MEVANDLTTFTQIGRMKRANDDEFKKFQTWKGKTMTKKLRRGYTTGTCAQAATKAAVTMLLGNVSVDQVTVSLPGKEVLTLKIAEAQKEFNKYNKSNRI